MQVTYKIDTQVEVNGVVYAFDGEATFWDGDNLTLAQLHGPVYEMDEGNEVEVTPEIFRAFDNDLSPGYWL